MLSAGMIARRVAPAVRCQSTAASLVKHLDGVLGGIRDAGTFKEERVIVGPQEAAVRVRGDGGEVINFCANNYLGLSNDAQLREVAKRIIDERGLGMGSVRFICGTQDLHKDLEGAISKFHSTQDTILYPSCFDANAGLFESILGPEDAVISDALNHASIIDGIRLCKAKRFRYDHIDMDSLEAKLKEASSARLRLIATDGVFSMDGHIAPLDKILDLAQRYDAAVFVDECHATGFFGPTGRGTAEYFGIDPASAGIIINSTLGKALGGMSGGYTTGPQAVVDILRQKARPYLFSNTIAPVIAGVSIAVMDRLSSSTELRDRLVHNTTRFREGISSIGLTVGGHPDHPIVPVMLYDAALATKFANRMLDHGVYVIGFSYPVVPMGQARIRVQVSAAHTDAMIDKTIAAFAEVAKELGVGERSA